MSIRSPNSTTTRPPTQRRRGRPPSPQSRERILDAALKLFAEHGYAETSVSDVQAASGLSATSGALYKHFRSKEQLLEAGIERELTHLEGVRVARRLIPMLGDFVQELEIIGRFVLMELAAERDLLRILLRDADRFPKVLAAAQQRLIVPMYEEFANWMRDHLAIDCVDVDAVAGVSLGAILQYRANEVLLGEPPAALDEERFLQAWVALVRGLVDDG